MEEAQAQLTIDLGKIAENYDFLNQRLKQGKLCSAVVKANAYGLGAKQVVKKLYETKACRQFYVSYLSEALTDIAPEAEFYILHGLAGARLADFSERTIPVLNSVDDLRHWSDFAKTQGKKLNASIHIDTGMNRLGLSAADIAQKGDEIRAMTQSLNIKYLMSHLACGEDKNHSKNAEQLQNLQIALQALAIDAPVSFANSSGIFLGQEYHFDQVRPGCALYGINPEAGAPNKMQATATLKARILQTRHANAGETVGYGASYRVAKGAKLATIAAGYADGMLRSLSNHQGHVYLGSCKCPILGRVSMDAIIIDISAVEGQYEWAEIIGEHQTVDDLATQAHTIGYEIFTSLGGRYKTVYND